MTVAMGWQLSFVENTGVRELAAAALAGGNGRDDSNGEDDGGHEVLRVAFPPGRALLRMALYTGVALDSRDGSDHRVPRSCRVLRWNEFVEEAWRREAARRARLARILRWAAAVAGAPCPPLSLALEAELLAAAAAAEPPPSFRPRRDFFDAAGSGDDSSDAEDDAGGSRDAEGAAWLRAQPAASAEPLRALLSEEAASARLQLHPDERRLLMEKLGIPSWEKEQRAPLRHLVLPMRRLALHQLCQLQEETLKAQQTKLDAVLLGVGFLGLEVAFLHKKK